MFYFQSLGTCNFFKIIICKVSSFTFFYECTCCFAAVSSTINLSLLLFFRSSNHFSILWTISRIWIANYLRLVICVWIWCWGVAAIAWQFQFQKTMYEYKNLRFRQNQQLIYSCATSKLKSKLHFPLKIAY